MILVLYLVMRPLLLVGRVKILGHQTESVMTDIRDTEPPLEGQKGFKGPAFLARFFSSRVERQADRDKQH